MTHDRLKIEYASPFDQGYGIMGTSRFHQGIGCLQTEENEHNGWCCHRLEVAVRLEAVSHQAAQVG